jgi:hypothetical protein
MRIIKLSKLEFNSERRVHVFFADDIRQTSPVGKFRMPKGWISKDSFKEGEKVVFTYAKSAMYTAIAKTGILENTDNRRKDYPVFFSLDLSTLKAVPHGSRDVVKPVAGGRGWNCLSDSPRILALWGKLR